MLLQTQPGPVNRTYVAREIDVQQRDAEIVKWLKDNPVEMNSSYVSSKNICRRKIFQNICAAFKDNILVTAAGAQ